MNPRVKEVYPRSGHRLELLFENGESRQFDVTPYLDVGVFNELRDPTYFGRARVTFGTVEWPNGQDFCPDTLYEASVAGSTQMPAQ